MGKQERLENGMLTRLSQNIQKKKSCKRIADLTDDKIVFSPPFSQKISIDFLFLGIFCLIFSIIYLFSSLEMLMRLQKWSLFRIITSLIRLFEIG